MFKISKLSIASLLVASVFLVSSCKKNENTDTDPTSAQDNALAESTSNDITSIAGEASENGSSGTYRQGSNDEAMLTSCASVVSVDTNTKIITVTFDGVTACHDGRVRGGTLSFDYSSSTNGAKHYRDPGFRCVITSSGYTVDGNQINMGSNRVIENTTPVGFNPTTTNETWTITADMSVTKSAALGGGTFTWNCTRYKTLLNTSDPAVYAGPNVPINWSIARVGLTGSASGTTVNGNSFTLTITSQLVRDFACTKGFRFISGTFTFTPSGKYPRDVDYGYSPTGSSGCDNWVKITIKGHETYKQI